MYLHPKIKAFFFFNHKFINNNNSYEFSTGEMFKMIILLELVNFNHGLYFAVNRVNFFRPNRWVIITVISSAISYVIFCHARLELNFL